MKRVYSKVDKDLLVLSLIRKSDITYKRQDLSPDNEFLQVSAKKITTKDFFRAHKHLSCEKFADTTQESWVILDGSVVAKVYDIDNSLLYEDVLYSGDCIVLFAGAHSLECMTDDTLLYEFKNGPYFGPDKDKKFI
jgi:hypothetical protein